MARNLATHVLKVAADTGTKLKAYEAAINHLTVAENHVGATADITGIYGAVRLESGLEYQNTPPAKEDC